jgi:hypothetical protein
MEESSGCTSEGLLSLRFGDRGDGVTEVKNHAIQNGFRLPSRDRRCSEQIRFYYHRGAREKEHRELTQTNREKVMIMGEFKLWTDYVNLVRCDQFNLDGAIGVM